MKHTGMIEINCGDIFCDRCAHNSNDFCDLFVTNLDCTDYLENKYECIDFYRCQQCLETFKEIKDEKNN